MCSYLFDLNLAIYQTSKYLRLIQVVFYLFLQDNVSTRSLKLEPVVKRSIFRPMTTLFENPIEICTRLFCARPTIM